MKNKYFPDEDIEENDLYFICYMIERVARHIKQKNKYVVNTIGKDELYHLISCADVLHCENPLKVENDWINDYDLKQGNYDITNVDKDIAEIIPSPIDMGAVYQRLIRDTMSSKEDYVDGIIRVYNNEICDTIDNYNCSAFYEPSYVIARAYQNGRFSFGGRDKMKKKIALIITIAVCIVSVSANVYQYRVIRNKDAQIVWNQTTEDQMFQGILGHIQEEILYLQTCEPDEKDFRIGVAFGYCREAVNAYITTSYGASWKEHDLQQMVSEFEGYLENLQSDETQWKNAKNGDLDRLYDAWSEVLTQIDKGKKARVAAASKVRQILKNCATSPTS